MGLPDLAAAAEKGARQGPHNAHSKVWATELDYPGVQNTNTCSQQRRTTIGEQSQRLSAATSAIKLAKGRSFSISVATVKLGRTGPERGVGGQVTHLGST